MELVKEEFMGSNDLSQIVKGRRTKRQRPSSPCKETMITSSSSSGCGGSDGRGGEEVVVEEFDSVFSSTSTSSDHVYESTEEEEEDMANCLILLAQGDGLRQVEKTSFSNTSASMKMEKFTPKKFSDFAMSAPMTNKAGLYGYECKTCNRSFPSFQALGGHRASHKKFKPTIEEKRPSPNLPLVVASMNDIILIDSSLNKSSFPSPDSITLQTATNNTNLQKGPQGNNNKVNKVHVCSICGSEFNSGQALGGHMRRHRANTGNNNQVALSAIEATSGIEMAMNGQDQEIIKPRNVLPLDLNLPAPEDDHYHHHHHRKPKFGLASTQQGLVLTAPALVDCHY